MTIFDSIQVTKPKVNSFDLSHDVKMSCNSGYLMPLCCIPVVPGDTFSFSPQVFARLQPLVNPVMHELDVRIETFYVPNRIIWPNFEDFIRMEKYKNAQGVVNPDKPVAPFVNLRTLFNVSGLGAFEYLKTGSLADYLGLPVQMFNGDFNSSMDLSGVDESSKFMKVSALPFAAYQKIYTEYYQDENVVDQSTVFDQLHDGDNSDQHLVLCPIRRRMYKKDYFTSALPNAQAGNDVSIPFNGGSVAMTFDASKGETRMQTPISVHGQDVLTVGSATSLDAKEHTINVGGDSDLQVSIDNSAQLEGEITSFDATIKDLRTAFSVQRALELSMRAGKRLKEQIYAFFGVKVPDMRVDRPEYLGSAKIPIIIGEVAQTSATDNTSPQANLAGRGAAAGRFSTGKKFFPEHGWFVAMISVTPKANYMQGLARHWNLFDSMDFYWPQFQHIGEQAILKKELFFAPTGLVYSQDQDLQDPMRNDDTFGYAPRYSEYKWMPSQIRGEFRTNLYRWHMARNFSEWPLLNKSFLEIGYQNVNRSFAVTDNAYHHFLLDVISMGKAFTNRSTI